MNWTQTALPTGGVWSALALAAVPIALLVYLLGIRKQRAQLAAWAAALAAGALALTAWQMPWPLALAAGIYGIGFALFPIGWIILAALYVCSVIRSTGRLESMRTSIGALTNHRGIQVLLIAFCFAALLEGIAGFGTSEAIAAATLVAIGFAPLDAGRLALLGNCVAVVFGAVGLPLITLSGVTGLRLDALSADAGAQLVLLAPLLAAWLVVAADGWQGLRSAWPVVLTTGLAYGLTQWWVSVHWGASLPAVLGGVAGLLTVLAWLAWHRNPAVDLRLVTVLHAWLPFILVVGAATLWNVPALSRWFAARGLELHVPLLHGAVQRPAELGGGAMSAIWQVNWAGNPGTVILLGALLTGWLSGLSLRQQAALLGQTLREAAPAIATVAGVMALVQIMNFGGLSGSLALGLVHTGRFFPFFAPIIGWMGVFLTGSNTSSNALFGSLQVSAASRLGLDPVTTASLNAIGGGAAKMISPQSIALAASITHQEQRTGRLLASVWRHSVALILMIALGYFLHGFLIGSSTALRR